jgi:hypothetical protein
MRSKEDVMRIGKLALAIAAVIVAPLVVLASAGCSLKFEARLLDPFNRGVSGTGEGALVARARHLLAGGLSEPEVAQNLVNQGQTEDEARRIVALAVAAQSKSK